MVPGGDWLSVEEAVTRTGMSRATVKRYATSAAESGLAVKVAVVPGRSKLAWRIEPEALAAFQAGNARRWPRAPVGARRPLEMDVEALDGVEVTRLLSAIQRQLSAVEKRVEAGAAAMDDARAARTAALMEKSVTEGVLAALDAQREAADASARAQKAQEELAGYLTEVARAHARATDALRKAFEGRSRQLDQLLTPGSLGELQEGGGGAPTSGGANA